jgi:hypothetical protein
MPQRTTVALVPFGQKFQNHRGITCLRTNGGWVTLNNYTMARPDSDDLAWELEVDIVERSAAGPLSTEDI